MDRLKNVFKSSPGFESLAFLGLVVGWLFIGVSPVILVAGDPFLLGPENNQIALFVPVIGLLILALSGLNFETHLITNNALIGLALIILAALINGYFSSEIIFNFWWAAIFLVAALPLFWRPFEIDRRLSFGLALMGLALSTVWALQEPDRVPLALVHWALGAWWITTYFPQNRFFMWGLAAAVFAWFGAFGLTLVSLVLALIWWLGQKKLYRRKAKSWWWLGLGGLGLSIGLVLRAVWPNFYLPSFSDWMGVGLGQGIATLDSRALSTVFENSIADQGLSLFLYEWGAAGLLLLLGLAFLWKNQKHRFWLWSFFLTLLLTVPGLMSQPYFWVLLGFFTFGKRLS